MAALTTITNISVQNIPIIVKTISSSTASDGSDLAANVAGQITIPSGNALTVETSRTDPGQLKELATKKLISYNS